MLKKLQLKFVVINMTIVTAMLFVIFGLVYNFTQRSLETESIGMMHSIALNPFRMESPGNASSDMKLPFFILQLGLRGELTATGGGYYDLSDQKFLKTLVDRVFESRREMGVIEEYGLRYCKATLPQGMVLVFADMSSEKNTLQNLLKSFAVIGSLSFLLFLGISIFLAKWAVAPVAKAWRQQKQFVADASHELKTPLTVILTNVELLESEAYEEAEEKNFLQSIEVMSEQMRQLVEKLLLLARSDNRQEERESREIAIWWRQKGENGKIATWWRQKKQKGEETLGPNKKNSLSTRLAEVQQKTDFSDILENEVLSFEGIFVEKGLWLESIVEPEIYVEGPESDWHQVVDILLDNAAKYSAEGGKTQVTLTKKDRKKCCLKVSNPGTPIPKEELKNIFLRFYRLDTARSRDGGQERSGSFGLGLAIAENIVTLHKGRIWAESEEGINSFLVELPTQR